MPTMDQPRTGNPFKPPGNSHLDDPHDFFKDLHAGPGNVFDLDPTERLTRSQARDSTKQFHDQVFASYETLQQILARHESTIRTRWGNRTKRSRLKILLEAWPSMPVSHRPDFQAFRQDKLNPGRLKDAHEYKSSFMWPYINQEDLSKKAPMLLLLNSRGRNPPWEFATADLLAMHFGMCSRALPLRIEPGDIMMLNGVSSAAEYGKLISWEEHPIAWEWVRQGKQFISSQGILVLEAQAKVLSFLVQICQKLLHDIRPADLTAGPVQPEPRMASEHELNGFESLAVMTLEAPYRRPEEIDLDLVESLLAAKAGAASDHLWALREDPGYFAEQFLESWNSRRELIPLEFGGPHIYTDPGHEDLLSALVMGDFLNNAHFWFECFSDLQGQARNLKTLHSKHSAVARHQDPSQEFIEALLIFRATLALLTLPKKLGEYAPGSPPLRRFFFRSPSITQDPEVTIYPRQDVSKSSAESELILLLRALWEQQSDYGKYAPESILLDELDRLLRAEPEAKALVSEYVAAVIENMSIISQCSAQLGLYQPWRTQLPMGKVMEGKIIADRKRRTDPWRQFGDVFGSPEFTDILKNLQPLKGLLDYPIDEHRTKGTVAALRAAEAALDAFWAQVDKQLLSRHPTFETSYTGRLPRRILQRTPAWVDPTPVSINRANPKAKKGRPKAKAKESSNQHNATVSQTSSSLDSQESDTAEAEAPVINQKNRQSSGEGVETPGQPSSVPSPQKSIPTPAAITLSRPNTKVKPRRIPFKPNSNQTTQDTTDHGSASGPQVLTEASTKPETIAVDARAHATLQRLFFDPDVRSTRGEVPWKDFLHAMAAIGFMSRKLYGSAWQFRPTAALEALGADRPIQFHEPHPHGKIRILEVRRMGRRLQRAYGWSGETFVAKERGSGAEGT